MKRLALLSLALVLALPSFAPQFKPHPLIKNLPGQKSPEVLMPLPVRVPLIRAKMAQARLAFALTNTPPMPFVVLPPTKPRCFQFYFDEQPASLPPFPAYTNFISSWNCLSNGTYYYFQTSRNLTNWVTREEGLWTGTMDDYFGMDLPKSYNVMETQRVFGTNPPPRASGLVQPAATPLRILQVRHKGEQYVRAKTQ